MKNHKNFYETLAEAEMRLNHTIVMYDKEPHYILCITNHKSDGIFRVFMQPLGHPKGFCMERTVKGIPYNWHEESTNDRRQERGEKMDAYLKTKEAASFGIIRKMMNSPKFDNFKPFPLGMCNYKGGVVYLERAPNRHTQQGLISSMIESQLIVSVFPTNLAKLPRGAWNIEITCPEFYDTVIGAYPSPQECLAKLKDPKVQNTGASFHRHFALMRGPANTLFLVYKNDYVGILDDNNFSSVKISKEFSHVVEVVQELDLFTNITVCNN